MFSDAFRLLDFVRIDFHYPATAVGHEDIILPVLLINDHVQRAVAVAKFGDRLAFDLRPGLQLADGELNQRCASVSCQQRRLVSDVEWHEGADWRAGLETPVCAMMDFRATTVLHFLEWERNRAQC